jgi:GntR family transcriptional regulator/MocR family aminotransferase
VLEFAFRPDRSRGAPIYRQLADRIAGWIAAGRLQPGTRLPASRELASALGLSRNTVNLAYQALADAELVTAHVGQGTFVARSAGSRPGAALDSPPARPRAFVWESLLAGRAQLARVPWPPSQLEPAQGANFDFRLGRVDAGGFPRRELKRCFAEVLDEDLPRLAGAPDPRGWSPLRDAIARRLVARGISCDAEQVVVTSGAQQALDLLARLLIDPGDFAAVEDPGYFGARLAFRAAEAHLLPIPVDGQGLRVDALERALRSRRVKLVYATPAVQCPTGVSLSEGRRAELLALAENHQTPVIEDDYDGELRHEGPVVPALKTRDEAGQVITIGTFSKAVLPGLRIGYVVAAPELMSRLGEAKLTADFGTSALEQAALTRWITSGGLDRHVRRLRHDLRTRVQVAGKALAEMPPGTVHHPPAGGHALWIQLPEGLDPRALRARAARAGVILDDPSHFAASGKAPAAIALSIVGQEVPELREGIARLVVCAHRELGTRRRKGGSK